MKTEDRYYNDQKRSEVMEAARRLRRKYLRYQQAEIVYSLSRKKTDGTGNRDTLRLWKENIYTDLSDQEKKSLFQDTIILECLYWGIDPVILEVETYKSETLMGYYSDQYYTISIREEMFDMPREEVLDTLLHETHHAYVHKAVQSVDWNDKNIEENKELRLYKDLQLYKQGIDNYIPADVNPDSYYNNPIEVAAREYAEEWGPKYLQYADLI